jgi:hypothetical protein
VRKMPGTTVIINYVETYFLFEEMITSFLQNIFLFIQVSDTENKLSDQKQNLWVINKQLWHIYDFPIDFTFESTFELVMRAFIRYNYLNL